jgi:uncharacterized membrane protein
VAAALTAGALLWVSLIVGTPAALAGGHLPWLTVAVYKVGSLVCHQRPERSFHLSGIQMPVCARCFGLYFGGAAGLSLAWAVRRRWSPVAVRAGLLAGAVPIALTVAPEWLGLLEPSNAARWLTGVPLGLVAGFAIINVLRDPN